MTTFPDKLFEFNGKPASGGFGGMWPAETVWFVDFDNGATANGGMRTDDAFKYLDTAISNASHGDVIYVRPRAPEAATTYYGGDPGDITPKTASTNWTIAYTKYGLSLIGTGVGGAKAGATQTCLQGDSTITSTPVFTVNAPYVSFENLGIKPGASTTGLVKQAFVDATAAQAYANSYYKVWFRNVDAAAGYSLMLDGGSYDSVLNCYFSGHPTGIYLAGTTSSNSRTVVRNCDFEVAPASVKAHIYCNGDCSRVLFHNLTMIGTIPTGGSPNKYISIASTSTGLAAQIYTGAAADTLATNMTLNGIVANEIYNAQITLMV